MALPCVTLKGTVSLNWPPVAFDAALLNHAAKADVSGTGIVAWDSVLPLDTVNVKLPLDNLARVGIPRHHHVDPARYLLERDGGDHRHA